MRQNKWGHLFLIGEGNGNPLQYSCLENPMDGGARQATVNGVAKSRTRLSGFTFTFTLHLIHKIDNVVSIISQFKKKEQIGLEKIRVLHVGKGIVQKFYFRFLYTYTYVCMCVLDYNVKHISQ